MRGRWLGTGVGLGAGSGVAAWLLGLGLGLGLAQGDRGLVPPALAQASQPLEPGLWRAELGDFNYLLNAVAFGAQDIWAVGDGIVHFDGTAWRQTLNGARPRFRAIDGVAPDQLWAAGEQAADWCDGYGLLYRYDGRRWVPEASGTHLPIYGLDLLRADLGWAVGGRNQAVILRYDGRAWQPVPAPEVGGLRAVQALAEDDVWAVGDAGAIVHFDGQGWEAVDGPSFADLVDLHLVRPGFGWAVGMDRQNRGAAVVLAFRDGAWLLDSFGEMPALFAVRSLDPDWTLAVGRNGVLMHHDGQAWREVGRSYPGGFNPWGFAPHPAGEPGGTVAGADASGALPDGDVPPSSRWQENNLYSLTLMPDKETLLAMGFAAQVIQVRDNLSWRELHSAHAISDIDMLDSDYGWAVGPGSRPLRWDGQTWSAPPAPSAARWLTDVVVVARDNVWAVGQRGTVLHWDGQAWTQLPRFTWLDIVSVAFSGPDDGWVTVTTQDEESGQPWEWNAQSLLFHWDGKAWRQALRLCHSNLTDIAALAPDQVWFSQPWPEQRVLLWDGRGFAWHPIRGFDRPTDVGARVGQFSVGPDGSVWGVSDWMEGIARLEQGQWRSLRLHDAAGEDVWLTHVAGAARDGVWGWSEGRLVYVHTDGLVEPVLTLPAYLGTGDVVRGPDGAAQVYVIGNGSTVYRYRAPDASRRQPLATVTPALAPPILHPTPTPFSAYDPDDLEARLAGLVDPDDEGPLRLDSLELMSLVAWQELSLDFLEIPEDEEEDWPWFWDGRGNLDPCDRGADLPVWVATYSASPRCPSHLILVMDGSGRDAWEMICYPRRLSTVYLPLTVRPRSPDDPMRTATPAPTLRSLTPESVQDLQGACPTVTPYPEEPEEP